MAQTKTNDDEHTLVMGVSFTEGFHLVTPDKLGQILSLLEGCEVLSDRYYTRKEFKSAAADLTIKAYTRQELNQMKLETMLETEQENKDD